MLELLDGLRLRFDTVESYVVVLISKHIESRRIAADGDNSDMVLFISSTFFRCAPFFLCFSGTVPSSVTFFLGRGKWEKTMPFEKTEGGVADFCDSFGNLYSDGGHGG